MSQPNPTTLRKEENTNLSQVVQQAGGGADVPPAAVLPAGVRPRLVEGRPRLTGDQHHVEVLLGSSQPLGQDAAVALVHKQQHAGGPAAGQVSQQLVDRVALLQVSLGHERGGQQRSTRVILSIYLAERRCLCWWKSKV